MRAIELRARKHFEGVRNGTIKPEYRPTISVEHPWQVCLGGNVYMDIADYHASQAMKNRSEAERLVKAPLRSNPFFLGKTMDNEAPKEVDQASMLPTHDVIGSLDADQVESN